jgi:hypothetical protein
MIRKNMLDWQWVKEQIISVEKTLEAPTRIIRIILCVVLQAVLP